MYGLHKQFNLRRLWERFQHFFQLVLWPAFCNRTGPPPSTHLHLPKVLTATNLSHFPFIILLKKKSIESLLGPVSSLIFIGTQIVIQCFKFHLICKCSLLYIRANSHLRFSHFTFKPITTQLVGNILYFCIQCSRMLIPDYREFSRLLLSGSIRNLKLI